MKYRECDEVYKERIRQRGMWMDFIHTHYEHESILNKLLLKYKRLKMVKIEKNS